MGEHDQIDGWRRWTQTMRGVIGRFGVTKYTRRSDHLSGAWVGATLLLGLVTAGLWAWSATDQVVANAIPASLRILGTGLVIALVAGGLLALIIGRLLAVPTVFLWVLLSSLVLLVTMAPGPSRTGWFLLIAVVVTAVPTLGAVVGSMVRSTDAGAPATWLTLVAGGLSLVILAAGGSWLLSSGSSNDRSAGTVPQPAAVKRPEVEDPSQPGPFEVRTLTYGSGAETQIPAYGLDTDLRTRPIDASAIVDGWSAARTGQWGFDDTAFPINARVWYPAGAGPFPLVLLAHGNNSAVEFSEAGFRYLGELLASRGFIAASVDENFLNSSVLDRSGGITGANPARGWLLLEHLKVWQEWNRRSGNPFHDRVDMGRIALVGHSRGGEAVAIGALFNTLDHYPEDESLAFDYGFDIRTVVALSPSDTQYLPGGERVTLSDVNYLTVQGSHDADVTTFGGSNQYARTNIERGSDTIKATLYIHRADHVQFNSSWGRFDVGQGISKHFINTAVLLRPEEQRRVAEGYVSAFLETTLQGQDGYRPLFADARVGHEWLPDTVYRNQYADGTSTTIADFDEDDDPATGSRPGVTIQAVDGASATEDPMPLRGGPGDSRVSRIEWDNEGSGDPRYEIALPAGIGDGRPAALTLDIADAATEHPGDEPVDFRIELIDGDGNTATVSLGATLPLQHPIRGQYLKAAFLQNGPLTEPVLQTYRIELEDLSIEGSDFDPVTVSTISLVFDDTPIGSILVDNVAVVVRRHP